MQGTPNQSAAGSPTYVGRTGGIRILFVEDDEGYRVNLVAELSERGFVGPRTGQTHERSDGDPGLFLL